MDKYCTDIIYNIKRQHGSVLVMSLIIMMVLSIVIIGFATDVDLDIKISRNLQLKNQAFNWAETGIDLTEELVAYSVDTRGDEPQNFSLHNGYSGQIQGGPLFLASQAGLNVSYDGTELTEVDVIFQGSRPAEGGAIIIAAGYEGVGKGAGATGGIHSYYQLSGKGFEKLNSQQRIEAMYRHVVR